VTFSNTLFASDDAIETISRLQTRLPRASANSLAPNFICQHSCSSFH